MIELDCRHGHFGELWWINSDPATAIEAKDIVPGLKRRLILWGTWGFGRDIRVALEPID